MKETTNRTRWSHDLVERNRGGSKKNVLRKRQETNKVF